MTSTFEDRLAAELSAIVAANSAPAANPAPAATFPPTGRRRRGLALGGAGAVAATAAIVMLQAGGASPAFAVATSPDGTVTVTIDHAADAAGLQQALRDHGVNAYVDYLPSGKVCAPGRYTPADQQGLSTIMMKIGASGTTFSVTSSQLKSGMSLVIENSLNGEVSTGSIGFAQGEVKPCTPVDASTVPGPEGSGGGLQQSGEAPEPGPGLSTHDELLPSPAA